MKPISKIRLLLLAVSILASNACQKDHNTSPQNGSFENSEGSWTTSDRDGEGATVLGQAKTNPYAVENIRQAYNSLYEPDISSLNPNYLYVRFLPQSPDDVKILLESNLDLWDFPLHYEIVSIGEYYHDPSLSDSTYTWQYAIVPFDYSFPTIQYEILEELALVPEDSQIAEAAFALTNNEYETPDEYEPNPPLVNGRFVFTPDHSSAPGGESGSRGGTCYCPIPDHTRKPSGCVLVFDNMLTRWDPVREVKVIVSKSRLFGIVFHRTDYTDEAGCWFINHKYKGKIHVWVKFESATCNIKTMKGSVDLWGYTFPRRAYMGKYGGPNFNNIAIEFVWTNSIGSNGFRNWAAATANNSIYEFQSYCSNNALPWPPGDLKILITPWGSGGNVGSAPMLDKFSVISQFILAASSSALFASVFGAFGLPPVGLVLGAWIAVAAPDITLNINDPSNVNSDDFREIMYHELAHAQHFGQVGQNYWLDEILFTIDHLGYGNANDPGAGRAAIIEMWGFQNGMWITHLRYGSAHSNPLGANDTWQAIIERRSYAAGYIPYGWQFDLQDNNLTNPSNAPESSSVIDGVTGYTPAQIFSTMNASMLSPAQQRSALLPMLPPGNTTAGFNALAGSYILF